MLKTFENPSSSGETVRPAIYTHTAKEQMSKLRLTSTRVNDSLASFFSRIDIRVRANLSRTNRGDVGTGRRECRVEFGACRASGVRAVRRVDAVSAVAGNSIVSG